jgi:hypothetical protein
MFARQYHASVCSSIFGTGTRRKSCLYISSSVRLVTTWGSQARSLCFFVVKLQDPRNLASRAVFSIHSPVWPGAFQD